MSEYTRLHRQTRRQHIKQEQRVMWWNAQARVSNFWDMAYAWGITVGFLLGLMTGILITW